MIGIPMYAEERSNPQGGIYGFDSIFTDHYDLYMKVHRYGHPILIGLRNYITREVMLFLYLINR